MFDGVRTKSNGLRTTGSTPVTRLNAISGHIHPKRYVRALSAKSLTSVNHGDDLSVPM